MSLEVLEHLPLAFLNVGQVTGIDVESLFRCSTQKLVREGCRPIGLNQM